MHSPLHKEKKHTALFSFSLPLSRTKDKWRMKIHECFVSMVRHSHFSSSYKSSLETLKCLEIFAKILSGSHIIFYPRRTPPTSELNSSTGRKKSISSPNKFIGCDDLNNSLYTIYRSCFMR